MLISAIVLSPAHGIASYVHESARALKDITEGQFDIIGVSEDGTTDLRMLVSAKNEGMRMTVLKGGQTATDVSYVDGKGIAIDHAGRTFQNFDAQFIERSVKAKSDEALVTVEPGTVSFNFDAREGLVLRATPSLENVRRWTDGGDELITGDIGKGTAKLGSFEWVRDAKTKLPRTFTSTVRGRTVEIRFVLKARSVSLKELRIPAESYAGYAQGQIATSGTL